MFIFGRLKYNLQDTTQETFKGRGNNRAKMRHRVVFLYLGTSSSNS